jgi:tetratricopeptide (TPR) repeat protein
MGNEIEKEAKNVNKMADRLYKKKNYTEAIKLYVESVNLMKTTGKMKIVEKFQLELDQAVGKRSEELNKKGDVLFKLKKYQEAIIIYQSAWDFLQNAGEKWIKKLGKSFLKELNKTKIAYAKIIEVEAEKFVKSGEWREARKKYEEICKIVKIDVDEKLSKSYIHKKLSVYEKWAQEVNKKGDSLYKEKKFEDAIDLYAESVRLIEKSDNNKLKKEFKKELFKAFSDHAQKINNMGDKYMKEKKYEEASGLYAQSVNVATDAGNQKLIDMFTKEMNKSFEKYSQSINEKGDKLFKAKKFEEAAGIYFKSVELAEESKNKKLIKNFKSEFEKSIDKWAKEVNNEGDLAMKKKKFDKAAQYYRKSVEIIKNARNNTLLKKYNEEYKSACLNLAKEVNSEGDKLYKDKKYEEAYNLYSRSVNLAEISGDTGKIKSFTKERNKALEKMQN